MAFAGNLGPGERRRRLMSGVVLAAVTLVLAIVLLVLDVNPAWRVVLLVPAFIAALGFSQAQTNT